MCPDDGFRIAATRGEQPHEGIKHVAVAQIPRFPGAAVHEPIVIFRGPHHPRVLRGVEEGFAVAANISEPPVEQILGRIHPAAKLIAALPERAVYFRLLNGH
jgi:hypothetical protein